MSENNEHQEKPAESPEQVQPDTSGQMTEEELLAALQGDVDPAESMGEPGAEGEGFANPLEALAAENTRQEAEISELNDQLLRMAAEMENLRRRTQKDVADFRLCA